MARFAQPLVAAATVLRRIRRPASLSPVQQAALCLFLSLLPGLALTARADVDLVWVPSAANAQVADIIELKLYAVADAGQHSVSAIDVILDWDPDYLQLLSVLNNGPYNWLFSGFPNDSSLDGLNNSFADGDALYQALARLGSPALVDTNGLLVTTFRFEALLPVDSTLLTIPPAAGQFTRTRVFDGEIPGLEIQGNLGSAKLTIVCGPEGGNPDIDGDGDVDLVDFSSFAVCFGGAGVTTPPDGCSEASFARADLNCNGSVELDDYATFAAAFTGGA